MSELARHLVADSRGATDRAVAEIAKRLDGAGAMNVPSLLQRLLWPLSLLYGAGVRVRVWLYANGWFKQKRLKCPVSASGIYRSAALAKTPMVIWLAEKFLADGKRARDSEPRLPRREMHKRRIELMKFRLRGRVSFGVGKNRLRRGPRLESRQSIDVFLLDDGFQHLHSPAT